MRTLLFMVVLCLAARASAEQANPWAKLEAWAAGAEIDPEPKAPPQSPLAEREARGAQLYGPYCARCHGTDHKGTGAAGVGLQPPPADFTSGNIKFKSTPGKPSELDLFRTITRGLHRTSMPSFADLPESDRWALAVYVHKVIPGTEAPALTPEPPKDLPNREGAKLFAALNCASCHNGTVAPDFRNSVPKRGRKPEDLYLTIRLGLAGTPMPPRDLPPDRIWDLVAHIRSQLPPAGTVTTSAEQTAKEQIVDSCAETPTP